LTFVGKEGVIFLSMGNDLTIDESLRSISNRSIREVTIQSCVESLDTGLVHFYLKLGDFKSYNIANPAITTKPPNKFVAEIELSSGNTISWHQLIEEIKPSFLSYLFYKFQITDLKGVLIPAEYNSLENQSFYKLKDESSYNLHLDFYDTESSTSNNYHSLKVMTMNEQFVKVVAPETIDVDARRDNRTLSIFTQTLASSNSFAYLSFATIVKLALTASNPTTSEPTVDTTVKIQLSKNNKRSFGFAFYSVLAALSVAYAQILTDKFDLDGSFSPSLMFQSLLAISIGFFSAFHLYRLFDKK
jgi:hypothetical protein